MVARLPTSPLVLVPVLLRFATGATPGPARSKYGAIVTARRRYEMTRSIIRKGSACYVW